MTFGVKLESKRSGQHRVSETAPYIMVQSWSWGSQGTEKNASKNGKRLQKHYPEEKANSIFGNSMQITIAITLIDRLRNF